MIRVLALFVAALSLPAVDALASQQPPAPPAGEEIIVTHAGSGQELRGRMLELSSTSLAILVNGQRVDVPVNDVLRIDVRNDSLKNGAIIGGAVMGGLGAIGCAAFGGEGDAGCAPALVINTLFGVLAGAGIDALHKGRTPIYVKPATSGGASLQVKFRF